MPGLMVLVKPQSLLHGRDILFHACSGRNIYGSFNGFLCVVEAAGLGASHAQRIKHERQCAVAQNIRLDGIYQRSLPVANLRFFIGGQHAGNVGEDLIIVRVDALGFTELVDGLGIAALSEQRLAHLKIRPRVGGVEPRGFGKFVHGLVEAAEFDQHDAHPVVQGWKI